jgi:PhoPQ-activated pathogenicity-related protein
VLLTLKSWVLAVVWVTLVAAAGGRAGAAEAATIPQLVSTGAIDAFIARPEPEFAWRLAEERQLGEASVFRLELTSQRWQDILWQHALMVYQPAEVKFADHMLLFVTGGSIGRQPNDSDVAMGLTLANLCGARIAVLHQVPNQPLMGGRTEDDLITETWLKYLDGGDTSWPLLFPMVNSAVKAMDALEQFSKARDWPTPAGFVVTGASKRGWTSWLTAATDPRIKAAAPMVIDMLNFPAQIRHQHELWGKPSEQIIDYTSKGLIREDGVPRPGLETTLWEMMDPYSYRSRVDMPKLLIVGASDRYWSTDAMNLYWEDLVGEKYIFRGANAGHGLEGQREQALSTLGVFFRHVASDTKLPELSWSSHGDDQRIGVAVQSDRQPIAARFWVAKSDSLDFRDAQWRSRPLQRVDDQWTGEEPVPAGRHVAVFAELVFEHDGLPYALATLAYLR